jgi:hypothetical protein
MSFIEDWYVAHCDGDWEHDERIRIGTLDNPGWRVWINLRGTELEGRVVPRSRLDASSSDWLDYHADGDVFDAACGERSLGRALAAFRSFAVAT